MAQVHVEYILLQIVKETSGYIQNVPSGHLAGHIVSHILKETHGFFHKVPPGHLAGYIVKELNMYLLDTCWLNFLRNHNVFSMETLCKWGSAPSARTTESLSELELTTLMFNTNHITAVLDHLQGVVGDMRTIQVWEQGRLLTASGESASLEIVATQVAERTLDEEFNNLSLSRVIGELEDFGNDADQEGPE